MELQREMHCIAFEEPAWKSKANNMTTETTQFISALNLSLLSDLVVGLGLCALAFCSALLFVRTLTFWVKVAVTFSLLMAVTPTVVAIATTATAISNLVSQGVIVETGQVVRYGWAVFAAVLLAFVCILMFALF